MKDIKSAIRLINSISVDTKNSIKASAKSEKDEEKLGTSIIGIIAMEYAENGLVEKRLAEFLAGPLEMSADDVLEMDIEDLINGIKEIGGIGYIMDFFKSVPA